jgi:hypothetical protein
VCMVNTSGTMAPPGLGSARTVGGGAQLQAMYKKHEWFQLRDAIAGSAGHGFFRGAVACAFNEAPECLDFLLPVIESGPFSRAARHAHDLLIWTYMRQGKFRSALAHIEPIVAGSPHEHGRHLLLKTLAQFPEQSLRRRRSCVLPYTMVEGSMFVPVQVNGIDANFMVDSGATISMITRSIARQMGLPIHAVPPEAARVYGATGVETRFHITVVAQLDIGECQLSDVTFIVLDDERFQFPSACAGALGLPVLIALQTLAWNRKAEFHLAFPPQTRNIERANICFDGPEPLINAAFCGQKLSMVLDTGSSATMFGPEFLARVPARSSNPEHKSSLFLQGISGNAEIASVCLPRVALNVGGFTTSVQPAHVLLSPTTPNSHWSSGRLGLDCLDQAAKVTLDFHCMKLTLENGENAHPA